MQEEVTQKSIALVIRTSKLTADVLKKAMIAYLNHLKNKQANWLIFFTNEPCDEENGIICSNT